MSLLVRGGHQVATPSGSTARRGTDLGTLQVHGGAVVRVDDGCFSFAGDAAEHEHP